MIERVVENWLTSMNERGGYEVAFRQLLAFKGHRILHQSSHGQMEQGKDIITIAPDNVPCAYQLKAEGDIGLPTWRRIKGEVDDLIEIPIQHPSVANDFMFHRAYLVNNGYLKDTVRRRIHDQNRVNAKRGYPSLNVIQLGDLHKDFVEIHGRFLPSQPREFKRFLELFLFDGSALLPTGQFSMFLLSALAIKEERIRNTELRRAIASTVVLANYVLSSFRDASNHVSLINGWVMVAAHIVAASRKAALSLKSWNASFQMSINAAEDALKAFANEILSRTDFRQGDPLTDGLVYQVRMTLILGYLTAYDNYLHLKGEESESQLAIKQFVETHMNELLLWSEGAIPLFLSVAWFLERVNRQMLAEHVLFRVVTTIVKGNAPEEGHLGLADPYHTVEDVLRAHHGLDRGEMSEEDFEGHSYGLQSLVELLARRRRRRGLAFMWEDISRLCYSEFIPKPRWATYLWYAERGELHHRFPKKPESWKRLVQVAEDSNFRQVENVLKQSPEFLFLFLLVYPHRLRPIFVRLLDNQFSKAT